MSTQPSAPNLSVIAPGLEYRDGIWSAKTPAAISYPDSGNAECYALEDDSFWFQHRNRSLLTLMKKFPPPGQLVDIGGGNGYQAKLFQESGLAVTLLEAGVEGVQHAQQRGVKELICSTLEQAQFLPGTLPAVGVFDVVEHIEDDQTFLQQLHTVIQPAGRLYVTVPAYQWLWSNEDVRAGHFRRYTIRSLSKRLHQAGFTIEYASYLFSPLPLPILIGRRFFKKLSSPKQHHSKADWLGFEIALLRLGWRIPFGSSCVIVARKI